MIRLPPPGAKRSALHTGTLDTFATGFRLKTRRDECGDSIIPGRRGELYFDGGVLCLMILDGPVRRAGALAALGGKLWVGDTSRTSTGRRVQDVRISGIPTENARLAIRLVGAKPRRILSDAQRAASAVGLEAARQRSILTLESPADTGKVV